MKDRNYTKYVLVAFFLLMTGLISLFALTTTTPIGVTVEPIYELGGDFTAVGTDGEFSLSDLHGSAVVMYFGFLSCTEACPDSIAVYQAARKKLTPEEREQVKFVFISVDPERDTPEKLKQFESFFNGRLIVVTDTVDKIETLTKQYGVYFDLVDLEGSALQYTVDHSSRFYMVDTEGNLVTAMSHSTTPNELAAKIRQLLTPTE